MVSTKDLILQIVVPSLGAVTGTFMSFAPYRAVLIASRAGTLGDLNPTPWTFMLGNCCGWIAYSFLVQNVFIFIPNALGFILAIWLNIQAIKLQYENYQAHEIRESIITALDKTTAPLPAEVFMDTHTRDNLSWNGADENADADVNADADTHVHAHAHANNNADAKNIDTNAGASEFDQDNGTTTLADTAASVMTRDYADLIWQITAQKSPAPVSHEVIVVCISTFWLTLITIVAFQVIPNQGGQILVIGLAVNTNLIFFYGAPLSRIVQVIQTKSSKSIHVPTMITNTLNGTLWLSYGLAVHDFFVAFPNGLGAFMGFVQIGLYIVYPRKSHKTSVVGGAFWDDDMAASSHASSTTTDGGGYPVETTPLI